MHSVCENSFCRRAVNFLSFCIQEAGFPPGVILEIRMYLDKGKKINNIFPCKIFSLTKRIRVIGQ